MKKTILIISAFCLIFYSCGPSKVSVADPTHKQVMDGYKTKNQIITKFGIPTSKRIDGDYEEFYYLFSVQTVTNRNASLNALFGSSKTKNSNSSANVISAGGMAYGSSSGSSTSNNSGGANANASAKKVTQEVKNFVKFTLNGDKVVNWESNGVDYGIYNMVNKKSLKK